MMSFTRTSQKTVAAILFFLMASLATTTAQADHFCREVLDSFDFEQGVFAGPDPDILPNRIHEYIQTRVEHQVNKGQLTKQDANYLIDSTTNELELFQDIAQTCRREPKTGIRLIDRLLEPHFKSGGLTEHQTESANRAAHQILDTIWKTCQVFWMEQNTPAPCTLNALKDEKGDALLLPEGLEVKIEDGSLSGFHARAWHPAGNKVYMMNAQGDVFENLIQENYEE